MTKEEKELVLKDLCGRLLYGVKILHETWNYEWDQEMTLLERVVGIDEKFVYVKVIDTHSGEEYRNDRICIDTFDDKMFLRPMSSMTEEERLIYEQRLHDVGRSIDVIDADDVVSHIDWLNKNMFDYRGLIPLGLGIDCTGLNIY